MALSSPKLTWCVVRLGEDMNWWVKEISDEIHWDLDGLSIIDPKQLNHLLDLVDPLRDYGFVQDVFESAFFAFSIEGQDKDGNVRLKRFNEPILETEEQIFTLADVMDEEKGPYADLLDHITRCRLKLLNDLIDFEQNLTVDELEEEIRERQNTDFMEGRATHVFEELTSILEYVPDGYEEDLEEDEVKPAATPAPEEEIEDDFPDVDEEETIEEDETMKWDEDEEEDDFDEEPQEEGGGPPEVPPTDKED